MSTFTIDPKQMDELRRVLNPEQLRRAIYQAVKRTTSQGRRIAGDTARDRLTLKREYIDKKGSSRAAIRGRMALGDVPAGEIIVRERPVPLGAYKTSGTKRFGTTTITDTQRAGITLRHTFRARVSSLHQRRMGVSHVGLFGREMIRGAVDAWWKKTWGNIDPAARARYRKAGFGPGRQKERREEEQMTPDGFAWRLPIREYPGPTVLDFITKDEIETRLLSKIGDTLQKNVDSQVSRFTDGYYTNTADVIEDLDARGLDTLW